MSEQPPQLSDQTLNISDSELENVQIGGISGRDLNVTQVQGNVVNLTVYDRIPKDLQNLRFSSVQTLTRSEYRQRRMLLGKVKEYWIKGVLNASLHTKTLIELGIKEHPNDVQQPFEGLYDFTNQPENNFPESLTVTSFFNQIGEGRTLLILGEPGSGKTITLLKLAQDLVSRAEEDISQLIPVPFNLSSWKGKSQSIASWLISELYEKYQVSTSFAKELIQGEQLILLLDGLDEVRKSDREKCVEAINAFTQEYSLTELATCCRIADYQQLSQKLKLRSAICVTPLSDQQINRFLDQADNQLLSVQNLINQDSGIKELASTPLMLSIMILANKNLQYADFRDSTPDKYIQVLLNAYIERMLSRRNSGNPQYSKKIVRKKLIWLAKQMQRSAQTIFLIEDLQANWIEHQYRIALHRLACGGVAVCLGIIALLIFGLLGGISLLWGFTPGRDENFLQYILRNGYEILDFVKFELLGLLILSATVSSVGPSEIKTVETLTWSWKELREQLTLKMLVGVIFGALSIKLILNSSWIGGLMGSIFVIVFCGLKPSEFQGKSHPNQGIRKSYTNILYLGLLTGLATILPGMIAAHIVALPLEASVWPSLGFTIGITTGFIFGGGKACLQHLALRIILFKMHCTPWNYARFLDYASDRLFLQKVGGGYIFIHRMLLEHFAAMELEEKTNC